jgi:hypothetical protein
MIFKYKRKQKYENAESVVSSSTAKYGEEMKKNFRNEKEFQLNCFSFLVRNK